MSKSNIGVVVYSGAHCPACIKAKEYLEELGIDYIEKNVDENLEAKSELSKLGTESLPTLIIQGQVIIGFSKRRISEAVRIGDL